MARNYTDITQVVNDFMLTIDGDDYVSSASDNAIRTLALRGLRDLGFDMLKVVRSLKMPVEDNNTVTLPDDYVDWTKIGIVGANGVIQVLGENKNINYSQVYSVSNGEYYDQDGDGLYDREDSKGSTNSNDLSSEASLFFSNYMYNGAMGRLYGVGGGHYKGQFRVNLDQNRIEIMSNDGFGEVVIEYIADEALSSNPRVHIYAEEAIRSYIYYKLVERKSSVPANEKMRARQEYYNERRLANSRLKSFTKEEALRTIRKNYKQAPKG